MCDQGVTQTKAAIPGAGPKQPITALIGSIQKFSVEDGPGIRTTVFLKGCPLSCAWCHNPELIRPDNQLIRSANNCIGCGSCIAVCPQGALSLDPEQGLVVDWERCDSCFACTEVCFARALRPVARRMSVDEVMSVVEQDKGFYDNTGGGLTISGGEALMHATFVRALIDAAADKGISVCLDTCGLGDTSTLFEFAHRENVIMILYDLKTTESATHKAYTGVDNEAVIRHLCLLAADEVCKKKLTVRMPLIHGVNDDAAAIQHAADLLASCGVKRIDLLPYHSLGESKQRNIGGTQQEFQPPTDERVAEIQSYFKSKLSAEVGILGKV